ncbi:MAG: hypothetical protein F4213_02765 [Boseongicola sp. SB0677_bin_26]|nr:hypothetical protein [Boseongicola sp. SB0665_bin_10]MYG24938.1 hypothetical protein [Boseongicola sp. SB0677_bin_26]
MRITGDELNLTRDEAEKISEYLRDLAMYVENCGYDDEINLIKPAMLATLPLAPLAPWIIRGIIIAIVRGATMQDAH